MSGAEVAALVVAGACVVALGMLIVAVRSLSSTLRSLEETMATIRAERPTHHRREAATPPPPVRGSHPVIKVMALGTGATRAARHIRGR